MDSAGLSSRISPPSSDFQKVVPQSSLELPSFFFEFVHAKSSFHAPLTTGIPQIKRSERDIDFTIHVCTQQGDSA